MIIVRIQADVDMAKMVKAFELMPEETNRQLGLGLKIAVRDVKRYASEHHHYTSRSGLLENQGLYSKIDKLTGTIFLNDSIPYAMAVHQGSRPHRIRARRKRALRWQVNGEGFRFARGVNHPGSKPDQFLYEAAKANEKHVSRIMKRRVSMALKKAGV